MKTTSIIYTTIFCGAMAASLLHYAGEPWNSIKIQDRADDRLARLFVQPDPSGKPNTTTIYKSNLPMPEFLKQTLATLWIEAARKKRFDPEIGDIVANQKPEECAMPGRVRMEDGNCWLPDTWRKLHP